MRARNVMWFLILGALLVGVAGIANRERADTATALAVQKMAPTAVPLPPAATAAPLPRLASPALIAPPPYGLAIPSSPPPIPRQYQDPKLTSPLAELRDAAAAAITAGQPNGLDLPSQLPDDLKPLVQAKMMSINGAGEVQVYVEVAGADVTLLEALVMAGVKVERVSDDLTLVQGWVSPTALNAVAALPSVESVRLPDYGFMQAGSVMTEGDHIIRADLVRSTYDVSGAGVSVGVISDGVGGLADSQTSGDLGSVDTSTCNMVADAPTSSGSEGTAMLEIVHDIAPGAQLYFGHFVTADGMGTTLDFNAAVSCLAAHTDVVVDDIGWINVGHYDGTSSVSANTSSALNLAGNPIRSYSTSAANFALNHYRGVFVDDNSGYHNHLFQSSIDTTDYFGLGPQMYDLMYLGAGGTGYIALQWGDSWSGYTNDYDLGLFGETAGTYVAVSTTLDSTTGHPIEEIAYTNPGAAGWFDIVIQKHSGSASTLDMYVLGGYAFGSATGPHHNYNTISHSVPNQSDAGGGVISAGAIDAADSGHDTIEFFSSQGPTADSRIKPDVTGIDGVTVTGNGGFGSPFYGTSAAAPHVAGEAALLLQCRPDLKKGEPGDNPSADRTTLRNLILNSAVDLGTSGMDNTFGAGRLDAYAAAAAAGCVSTPTPTPSPTATATPAFTPTPTSTPEPDNACGNANSSGGVTMVDAMLTAQCVVGLADCSSLASWATDVNCSGGITMVDAMLIAQKVVGLVPGLNCCG